MLCSKTPDITVPAIVPTCEWSQFNTHANTQTFSILFRFITIIPPYVSETMKLRSFNGTHDESNPKQAGNIGPWEMPINTLTAMSDWAPPETTQFLLESNQTKLSQTNKYAYHKTRTPVSTATGSPTKIYQMPAHIFHRISALTFRPADVTPGNPNKTRIRWCPAALVTIRIVRACPTANRHN